MLLRCLFVVLLLCPAANGAKTKKALCQSDVASAYALAIATKQYAQPSSFAKKPFKVKEVSEVTDYYFKEAGMDAKKIAESQKNNPVEVHQVILESVNHWECIYYVTLSTAQSRYCDFSAISFHFCSK